MWRWLLALVLLAGIASGVIFGVLNPDPVTLDLAAFNWTATLGTIVTLAFGAGVLVGCLAMVLLRLLQRPRPRANRMRRSTTEQGSIGHDA